MKKVVASFLLHIIACITLILCFFTVNKGAEINLLNQYISNENEVELKEPDKIFNFKLECANSEILKDKNEKLELIKQMYEKDLKQKAFQLLNDYVGKYSSNCFTTAINFVKELKCIEEYELVEIKENEVQCGDLIFYARSSVGTTHWAVYLDYETALQGKWTNNRNIIGLVHYDNFSKPIFYRVMVKEG